MAVQNPLTDTQRHEFYRSRNLSKHVLTLEQRKEWNDIRKQLSVLDKYPDEEKYVWFYFLGKDDFEKMCEDPQREYSSYWTAFAHLAGLHGESTETIFKLIYKCQSENTLSLILTFCNNLYRDTGQYYIGDTLSEIIKRLIETEKDVYLNLWTEDEGDLREYFKYLHNWAIEPYGFFDAGAFPPNIFMVLFPNALKLTLPLIKKQLNDKQSSMTNVMHGSFFYCLHSFFFPNLSMFKCRTPDNKFYRPSEVHKRHVTQMRDYIFWYWRSQQWEPEIQEYFQAIMTPEEGGEPLYDISYQPEQSPFDWPNEKIADLQEEIKLAATSKKKGSKKKKIIKKKTAKKPVKPEEVYDEFYGELGEEFSTPYWHYVEAPVKDGLLILEDMVEYLVEHQFYLRKPNARKGPIKDYLRWEDLETPPEIKNPKAWKATFTAHPRMSKSDELNVQITLIATESGTLPLATVEVEESYDGFEIIERPWSILIYVNQPEKQLEIPDNSTFNKNMDRFIITFENKYQIKFDYSVTLEVAESVFI